MQSPSSANVDRLLGRGPFERQRRLFEGLAPALAEYGYSGYKPALWTHFLTFVQCDAFVLALAEAEHSAREFVEQDQWLTGQ